MAKLLPSRSSQSGISGKGFKDPPDDADDELFLDHTPGSKKRRRSKDIPLKSAKMVKLVPSTSGQSDTSSKDSHPSNIKRVRKKRRRKGIPDKATKIAKRLPSTGGQRDTVKDSSKVKYPSNIKPGPTKIRRKDIPDKSARIAKLLPSASGQDDTIKDSLDKERPSDIKPGSVKKAKPLPSAKGQRDTSKGSDILEKPVKKIKPLPSTKGQRGTSKGSDSAILEKPVKKIKRLPSTSGKSDTSGNLSNGKHLTNIKPGPKKDLPNKSLKMAKPLPSTSGQGDTFKDSDDEDPSGGIVPEPKKITHKDIPDNSATMANLLPSTSIQGDTFRNPDPVLRFLPVTALEVQYLRETEHLYNNNLLRLQIEETLPKVSIKKKRIKYIEAWMDRFKQFVSTLPEYEFQLARVKMLDSLNSAEEELMNHLAYSECPFRCDQDMPLKFPKPLSIEHFGLYENNSQLDSNIIVTINVVMPRTCFQEKDYLNYRYLTKKYYYLRFLRREMRGAKFAESVNLTYYEQNFLLPVLTVEAGNSEETKMTILIFATPEDNMFKPSRFIPLHYNIKQTTFNLYKVSLNDQPILSSVFYNNTLAFDITLSKNNHFISEILKDSKELQDGIKLLSIWLKQRELHTILGGLTETLVMYLVVFLFHRKLINKYMSSYQVMRTFWTFINKYDIKNNSISLGNMNYLDAFKKYYDVIFLDITGCYNLTGFMSLETYKKIQYESGTALKFLDNAKINSFHEIFFVGYSFHLQYDAVIYIPLLFDMSRYDYISGADVPTFFGYPHLYYLNNILKTIRRSLGKRYLHITSKLKTEGKMLSGITIGILLNPDEAFSMLEIGPTLNDVAANDFKRFWGDLASDRRFRDGSTNVTVHFPTNTISSKRGIVKKILDFVFHQKLDIKSSQIFYNEFEEAIVSKIAVPTYPSGTNEETTLKAIRASDELGNKMRSLQMSLKITGIQGTSDALSYTMPFPPIPTNYETVRNVTVVDGDNLLFNNEPVKSVPRYVQSITSVIQLEHSSSWPNDLSALRNIKAAFYLDISKHLRTKHNIISRAKQDCVEVLYHGFVFKYYLYIPKEVKLVKMTKNVSGLYSFSESENSIEIEKSLDIVPKVMGAIKGVQAVYPSFGPGTALIKRWIRAQMIDDFFFSDIVINLLNASLYLNIASVPVSTPQLSFLRFLNFFSHFDWNTQSVLVDFNNEMSFKEYSKIELKLQKDRSAWPLLYIITTIDQGFSIFTAKNPTVEILFRIKNLATESLKYLNNMFDRDNRPDINIKPLFTPNYEGYNVLIYLNKRFNPRNHERSVFGTVSTRLIVEEYRIEKPTHMPIVDFNPVDIYLTTLRKNYGKFALFFHDSYGGDVIGVLWRPKTHDPADFKVSEVNGMKLENEQLHFNVDAAIEDFRTLGLMLVKSIKKVQE